MGRRRACLPIPAGLPHYPQISRGQTLGRSAIPDCPGGSTGTSRPFASLRAKGRSASGRVPPMDYLDNPERRSAARPSDDTSANSYGFAVASTLGKEPSQLTIEQVDAPLVSSFLDDLETRRGIGARSRNLRLTAIRSFFRFAAFELPAQSESIQRGLTIPCKRCVHEQIHYLTRPEVDALLAAPDQTTWSGRRDHAWLLLAVQTG